MHSIGRLWRRAPTWRMLLFVALASTALAAMFPPAAPRWLTAAPRLDGSGPPGSMASEGAANGRTTARFMPQSAGAAPDYVSLEQPPLGPPRSGVVAFAGRELPLPAGGWQTLMLVRAPGTPIVQQQWLGRIDGNTLTGLLLATGPTAVAGGIPPASVLQSCDTINTIAVHNTPVVAGNPFVSECWNVGVTTVNQSGAGAGFVLPKFDRLTAAGVTFPPHMLGLRYNRSDQNGWLAVTLLLPDRPVRSSAENRRAEAWASRFAALLHRGFDRELSAGDLLPATIRDPA